MELFSGLCPVRSGVILAENSTPRDELLEFAWTDQCIDAVKRTGDMDDLRGLKKISRCGLNQLKA